MACSENVRIKCARLVLGKGQREAKNPEVLLNLTLKALSIPCRTGSGHLDLGANVFKSRSGRAQRMFFRPQG